MKAAETTTRGPTWRFTALWPLPDKQEGPDPHVTGVMYHTHEREYLKVQPQLRRNYSQNETANKILYCLSTVVLNNCLPCTVTVVWGGEGSHGAPQCDGSALICPVWPIHMCPCHCFHILNTSCHVTQGNLKSSTLKSFINFLSDLISTLPLGFTCTIFMH